LTPTLLRTAEQFVASSIEAKVTVAGFDSASGVLVGANATLAINPTSYLSLTTPEGGSGRAVAIAGVRWSLDTANTTCGTGCTFQELARITSDRNGVFHTHAWAPSTTSLGSAAALNSYVNTPATITLNTTLLADNSANGKTASASLTDGSSQLAKTALTGSINMQYSYLHHAQASFAGGLIKQTDTGPEIYFDQFNKAGDAIDLTVTAGGLPADTTGLQFRGGYKCSGACGAFGLNFEPSFADVVAGTTGNKLGSVKLLGDPGNYAAVYAFTFWDTSGTGATNSQKSHVVTLTIESGVPAVPEPHSAAMLLAGLGAIGWMSRRRRSSRDQVAKL
jgi:hypothetical protein